MLNGRDSMAKAIEDVSSDILEDTPQVPIRENLNNNINLESLSKSHSADFVNSKHLSDKPAKNGRQDRNSRRPVSTKRFSSKPNASLISPGSKHGVARCSKSCTKECEVLRPEYEASRPKTSQDRTTSFYYFDLGSDWNDDHSEEFGSTLSVSEMDNEDGSLYFRGEYEQQQSNVEWNSSNEEVLETNSKDKVSDNTPSIISSLEIGDRTLTPDLVCNKHLQQGSPKTILGVSDNTVVSDKSPATPVCLKKSFKDDRTSSPVSCQNLSPMLFSEADSDQPNSVRLIDSSLNTGLPDNQLVAVDFQDGARTLPPSAGVSDDVETGCVSAAGRDPQARGSLPGVRRAPFPQEIQDAIRLAVANGDFDDVSTVQVASNGYLLHELCQPVTKEKPDKFAKSDCTKTILGSQSRIEPETDPEKCNWTQKEGQQYKRLEHNDIFVSGKKVDAMLNSLPSSPAPCKTSSVLEGPGMYIDEKVSKEEGSLPFVKRVKLQNIQCVDQEEGAFNASELSSDDMLDEEIVRKYRELAIQNQQEMERSTPKLFVMSAVCNSSVAAEEFNRIESKDKEEMQEVVDSGEENEIQPNIVALQVSETTDEMLQNVIVSQDKDEDGANYLKRKSPRYKKCTALSTFNKKNVQSAKVKKRSKLKVKSSTSDKTQNKTKAESEVQFLSILLDMMGDDEDDKFTIGTESSHSVTSYKEQSDDTKDYLAGLSTLTPRFPRGIDSGLFRQHMSCSMDRRSATKVPRLLNGAKKKRSRRKSDYSKKNLTVDKMLAPNRGRRKLLPGLQSTCSDESLSTSGQSPHKRSGDGGENISSNKAPVCAMDINHNPFGLMTLANGISLSFKDLDNLKHSQVGKTHPEFENKKDKNTRDRERYEALNQYYSNKARTDRNDKQKDSESCSEPNLSVVGAQNDEKNKMKQNAFRITKCQSNVPSVLADERLKSLKVNDTQPNKNATRQMWHYPPVDSYKTDSFNGISREYKKEKEKRRMISKVLSDNSTKYIIQNVSSAAIGQEKRLTYTDLLQAKAQRESTYLNKNEEGSSRSEETSATREKKIAEVSKHVRKVQAKLAGLSFKKLKDNQDPWNSTVNEMLLKSKKALEERAENSENRFPRPDSALVVGPIPKKPFNFLNELLEQDQQNMDDKDDFEECSTKWIAERHTTKRSELPHIKQDTWTRTINLGKYYAYSSDFHDNREVNTLLPSIPDSKQCLADANASPPSAEFLKIKVSASKSAQLRAFVAHNKSISQPQETSGPSRSPIRSKSPRQYQNPVRICRRLNMAMQGDRAFCNSRRISAGRLVDPNATQLRQKVRLAPAQNQSELVRQREHDNRQNSYSKNFMLSQHTDVFGYYTSPFLRDREESIVPLFGN